MDLNWQNVHYLSYVTRAIDLLQDLDALRALPLTDYRLPMERDGDVVFTDEMAGAIALKHNDVRMYVSLNWRHGFRGNERAYGTPAFNIARIHYTTDAVKESLCPNELTVRVYAVVRGGLWGVLNSNELFTNGKRTP